MRCKNIKKGVSEYDFLNEIEKHPDLKKLLTNKRTIKKCNDYRELMNKGYDAIYPIYRQYKQGPFFKKITNWIRPYSPENSEVYPLIKNNAGFDELFKKASYMCNSDKHSLAYIFLSNLGDKEECPNKFIVDEEFLFIFGGTKVITPVEECEVITNYYIQDIYRLFTLSSFKLPRIFKTHINLIEVEALRPILYLEETLRMLGEFYMDNGYYSYAQEYFIKLLKKDLSDYELYQKIGYCKQMSHDYTGAIDAYTRADQISEDFWTFCQLAKCYKKIGNTSKAIEFYTDALRLRPNSENLEIEIANCLMFKGQYEEALKYYYKIDFMTDGSPKVWQQIARCSLLLDKLEEANRYIAKVLSHSPSQLDYLNAGHISLAQNKIKEACQYYMKGAGKIQREKKYFDEAYMADYQLMLKLGFSKNDIAVMRDIYLKKV